MKMRTRKSKMLAKGAGPSDLVSKLKPLSSWSLNHPIAVKLIRSYPTPTRGRKKSASARKENLYEKGWNTTKPSDGVAWGGRASLVVYPLLVSPEPLPLLLLLTSPASEKAKPTSRFGFLSTAKSIVQSVWNRSASSSAQSQIPVSKTRKEEAKPPVTVPHGKKVAVVPGSSGHPPLNNMSQAQRVPSENAASERQTAQTLALPASSTETSGTASSRTSRAPIPTFSPLATAGTKSTTSQGGHSRNGSAVGMSSLGMRTRASESTSGTSSMGKRTSIRGKGTDANSHSKPTGNTGRTRPSSTLMAPTASSLAKMTTRHSASLHNENVGSVKGGATKTGKDVTRLPVPSSPALGQITNGTCSPQSPRSPTSKIFSQPLSPATMRSPMSLTAAAESIVKSGIEVGPAASSSSKPPIPPKPKVLPGRKPRISRSKVIARLASQRAAEATAFGAGVGASRGKTRSSIGAGVSGKTRLSRGGAKSGEVLMSAKKRARQSEYARRRSQATGSDCAEPMEVRVD
ncbi:hypothetical protein PISMIDRAFT_202327 [Pisolithus microcarpus 441]|uniref:Uncharacterized protein n=1 Tax=Pisolithus microcarpus 441 TaxID=765257 RepID=A0A0C9YQ83_9AGAM|nr:hypothetical protein PISMIDRAFT_202327 [Pisolithus microcarpus 441]